MLVVLIWMTGALVCGQLCRIASLPVIVGFIAAGYFFNLTGFTDKDEILALPSEIGIELLLFSIGLKIKPSSFFNFDVILVFLIHSAVVALTYFFLSNLHLEMNMKLLLCLALTLSSTVIASKSLESRRELKSFHGRLSIIFLVLQDILAMALILYTATETVSYHTLYLLLIIPLIPILHKILSHLQDNEELELISAIILALFFGAFLFKSVGLTGELGALTLGVFLSTHKASERLAKKIWGLRELLLLGFFISLGMKLEINTQIITDSLMILSMIIIKSSFLFLLLTSFKLRAYTSFLVVISLATYSEFLLILASYWVKSDFISQEVFALSVCTVCISFVLGSTLNKYAHEIFVFLEAFLIRFERSKHHPDEQPHTCGEATIMVVGMGRLGSAIFISLQNNNFKVAGFDADTDCVKHHLLFNRRVTFADVEDPSFWSQLRLGKLETIILAMPTFHAQRWSILQARKFGFVGKIIVPVRSPDEAAKLKEAGADHIYDPFESTAIGVKEILMNNITK